jgi:hypothetical protein
MSYKKTKTMSSRDIIISLMFILLDKNGNILFNQEEYCDTSELNLFNMYHQKNGGICMAYIESIDENLIPKHLIKNAIPKSSKNKVRSSIVRSAFICQDLNGMKHRPQMVQNKIK